VLCEIAENDLAAALMARRERMGAVNSIVAPIPMVRRTAFAVAP
jgi:hypothetical protein